MMIFDRIVCGIDTDECQNEGHIFMNVMEKNHSCCGLFIDFIRTNSKTALLLEPLVNPMLPYPPIGT